MENNINNIASIDYKFDNQFFTLIKISKLSAMDTKEKNEDYSEKVANSPNPIPNEINLENLRPKNDDEETSEPDPADFDEGDYEDTNNGTDPIANPDNYDQHNNPEQLDDLMPNPDDYDEGDSDDTSDDSERDATRTPGL